MVLRSIYDAGYLPWDDFRLRFEQERSRVLDLAATKESPGGGNFYYTQPIRLSRQFTQAVISATLEGITPFREAYRLLGIKKHRTFEGLAANLGVA